METVNVKDIKVECFTRVVICPECGEGEMNSTGNGFSNSAGAELEHRCDKCGFTRNYPGSYPRTIYRRLNEHNGTD